MIHGIPHEMNGQYVVSFDPDYHLPDGSYDGGALICTPDPEKATLFTPVDAFLLIKSSPTCPCHRNRADGKRNRPLAQFNCVIG